MAANDDKILDERVAAFEQRRYGARRLAPMPIE